jgi:hypothetical protein
MNRFNDEKSVQKGVAIMRRLKSIASTEFLLLCGVVGPPLFFVALLIEGATRPDVKGDFEKFRAAGAKVVREPYNVGEESPYWIATFADPDDNYFQLMSPM